MASKNNKKTGWLQSIGDFYNTYGKAVWIFAAVASVSYGLGYKTAEVFKEREIMSIENKHSAELLNLKEEYMEKYFSLRERIQIPTPNDSTDESKSIYRQH